MSAKSIEDKLREYRGKKDVPQGGKIISESSRSVSEFVCNLSRRLGNYLLPDHLIETDSSEDNELVRKF